MSRMTPTSQFVLRLDISLSNITQCELIWCNTSELLMHFQSTFKQLLFIPLCQIYFINCFLWLCLMFPNSTHPNDASPSWHDLSDVGMSFPQSLPSPQLAPLLAVIGAREILQFCMRNAPFNSYRPCPREGPTPKNWHDNSHENPKWYVNWHEIGKIQNAKIDMKIKSQITAR